MTACVEAYGCAVGHGKHRDAITAAGLVGARNPLATSAWRLKYGNDAKEFNAVLGALLATVRATHGKHAKAARSASKAACKRVLMFWLSDICPACLGRGANHIDNTPHLADKPCQHCSGTGRRLLDKYCAAKTIEQEATILAILQQAEHVAASDMMRKLARNMDL